MIDDLLHKMAINIVAMRIVTIYKCHKNIALQQKAAVLTHLSFCKMENP